MMMKKYLWTMLLSLFVMAGCESLEDTYSDYAGDGAIRYVGKCSEVSVSPGWKRLIVKWVNQVDPMIDKVKVSWKIDAVTRDTLISKDSTECSIPNLKDGNYEVTVCNVDQNGKSSLSIPRFGRPYTSVHETILTFTHLIAKHYFVDDRLALFFSAWQDNVSSATLNYYTPEGNPKRLELNQSLVNKKYYLLPDKIDRNRPVTLHREGRVEGCSDLIVFEPYDLPHDKIYTSDFKLIAKAKYGQSEITDNFINSLQELEIDYSINSFEDILNIPNLKVLALGKNRFMDANVPDANKIFSQLYDVERSIFVLDVAKEVRGVQVERYNKHYFNTLMPDYVIEKGNPMVPDLACFNAKEWKISCSPEDTPPFNSYLMNLFDGNFKNYWQPDYHSPGRPFEIVVDMNEMKVVNGVRVVQRSFPADDKNLQNLLPSVIKIKVSTDQTFWEDANYVDDYTIGATNGEISIIHFVSPKNVRYMKFVVYSQALGANFSVTLADIGIF